jgi:hypothetical protein
MATPIFVAVASAVLLKEKLEKGRFAAVVVGFIGVILALGAGLDSGWLPTLVAICGVCVYSGYLLSTRALRGTSATVLATYQMGGALLFGLVMLPFAWIPPTWVDVALLMGLGLVGVAAGLVGAARSSVHGQIAHALEDVANLVECAVSGLNNTDAVLGVANGDLGAIDLRAELLGDNKSGSVVSCTVDTEPARELLD